MVAARRRADGARALRRRRPREGGAPRARTPAGARARRGRQGLSSPARYDAPPPGWRAGAARRDGAASRRSRRCARARRGHADTYGRVYYKSKAKRRWQVSFFAPPACGPAAHEAALADRRRRPQRPRARELDGLQGRVDDGARLRRRLSGASPTRSRSGCRCARCSCCRSPARRCGCCTSTSRCCSRFSVSYAFFDAARSTSPSRSSYPLLVLPARAHARRSPSPGAGRGRRRCG